MSESYFERFRRMMDLMEFETLPLFSKPLFSWNLHTDYTGRRFQYRPYTESTQEDARRMLERWRLTSGTIILAEQQTAGRGRANREWVSPPDVNLHFTLVLFLEDADPRKLSFVTPLAIAEAVEQVAKDAGGELSADLKWPNDVLIDGRKTAGVLIEMAQGEDGTPVALIGAGVNVNLDPAEYPEIADIATSVKQALGFEVSRELVLAAFADRFEAHWESAKAGSSAPFEAWKERLVTLGAEVSATGNGATLNGRAVDVRPDGTLVLELEDGTRHTVEAGDVTLRSDGS